MSTRGEISLVELQNNSATARVHIFIGNTGGSYPCNIYLNPGQSYKISLDEPTRREFHKLTQRADFPKFCAYFGL